MNLLKEWRIWLLILIVVGSILAINPNPWAKGVVVKYVEDDSPFKGEIFPGEKIDTVNDIVMSTPDDFMPFENYTGMVRIFHNGKLALKEVDGGLGLEVDSVGVSNLKLGMDLVGGTRVLLEPEYEEGTNESDKDAIVDQIISTLETRTNVYGLKEINYQVVKDVEGNRYVQIEVAGASKKEIDELLGRQGKFEAYVSRAIDFDTGIFEIGDKNYTVRKIESQEETLGVNDTLGISDKNYTIKLNGEILGVNDTIELNSITFKVWNITNTSAVIAGRVFTGLDIKYVYFDPQHSYIRKRGDGWEFLFQILVSDEGAQRFATVTEDIPIIIDPKTGEKYLEESIYLFLDEKFANSLRIGAGLAGQPYSTPQINGWSRTEEGAIREQRRLQSILRSGSLPVDLKISRIDSISPSLGSQFLNGILIAGVCALIAVSVVLFVRYRKIKITLPILMISTCEVVIILGAASLINWTIDLAAIAGIVAAVGTGVDAQIIITDEAFYKKEEYSIKEKVKRAFFIIFGAASTTIAAMIPLMVIGIGVMRGFAITTTIGILAGIFITRPVYAKIVEKFSDL